VRSTVISTCLPGGSLGPSILPAMTKLKDQIIGETIKMFILAGFNSLGLRPLKVIRIMALAAWRPNFEVLICKKVSLVGIVWHFKAKLGLELSIILFNKFNIC